MRRKSGFLARFFGRGGSRRAPPRSRNALRMNRPLAIEPLECRRLLSALAVTAVENQYTPGATTDGSLVTSIAGLNYVSGANGSTVVSADAQLDANDGSGHDLSYVTAAVTLHGSETVLNTVYYSGSGVDTSASYRFSVPILGQNYTTGRYEFDITVTEFFSGTETTDSQTQQVYANVLNRGSSLFGPGFNLDGLDQLFIDGSGILYVRSDGTMGYFAGTEGPYTPPNGPFAFMTLNTGSGGGGGYVLKDQATGVTEDFNSAGLLESATDGSGNTSSYYWSEVDDVEELASISEPGGRDTDFSYNADEKADSITDSVQPAYGLDYNVHDQLTSVTEPKPFDAESTQTLAAFTYTSSSPSALMYSYSDALGNPTYYSYHTNDDTLETVDSPDGSSTGYQAAASPVLSGGSGVDDDHLANLVLTSAAQGVVTTGSGSTYYSLDSFGNSTSVINADDDATGSVLDSNGLTLSTTNPDGQVTASNYDGNGNATATFQGQILAPTSDTWTFNNLAPNAARTYGIYIQYASGSTPSLTVTYGESTLTPSGSAALPASSLGSDWYWVGTVTLPAGNPSTPLVITHSGAISDKICLLEPMSTMVYCGDNERSSIDPMGNVTATSYDGDNRPVTTSQGQVHAADPTFHSAAFENVPQAPGMARTLQIYVVSDDGDPDDYSFSDTAGSIGADFNYVGGDSTPLGSGWFYLGYLALPAGDTSSTVTISNLDHDVSQYALLQQTAAITYNAAGEVYSTVDGLNRVTAAAYDGTTNEQDAAFQGQIVTASGAGDATFQNLPQAPGQAQDLLCFHDGFPVRFERERQPQRHGIDVGLAVLYHRFAQRLGCVGHDHDFVGRRERHAFIHRTG